MADVDLRGTVLDGRYKVIEPIAEGAMGSVYRGERIQLGRAVAIKVMHKELPDELASRQRFEREAKLMALLEHPNCVSVIDFGLHDEKPFLVMELVRGTSLIDLLAKSGTIEVAKSADIVRQVLSGLAHAHELGIVHRDIKPANIMISEKAGLGLQVRILDFGLARLTESSTKLTTGIVVGTPNYMAPEQCKGGDIDARTDLYACGVMLFEMLTGRKPFVADDPLTVVRKHLMEQPPTMASVEPRVDFGDLEAVVAKALAKKPDDRYASAVDMSKAVEAAAAKLQRTSAAALFNRAIPDNAPAAHNQQATMSGWNVPQSGAPASPAMPAPAPGPASAPGTQMLTDSMVLPAVDAAAPPPHPTVVTPSLAESAIPGATASTNSGPSMGLPASAIASEEPAFVFGGDSAAPDAPLSVPPTRPSTVPPTKPTGARPAGQLPFSRRQLAIGGGAVLLLVIIIAIAAGGSSKKGTAPAKPVEGGSGSAVIEMPPDDGNVSQIVERANGMLASEDYDGAVRLLRGARKDHPDNAELAFVLGKAYFGQLWWADGVDSFRAAIKLDPSYKDNPELLKAVLKGFLTTPSVDDRIVEFMRRDIGPPLRPYLEETAQKHPKKALRARAQAELDAR